MSSPPARAAATSATAEARTALRLTRSITATWWYVALAIVVTQLIIVILLVDILAAGRWGTFTAVGVGVGGLLWWLSTLPPLLDYRHRTLDAPLMVWRRHLAPLLTAAAYGLAAGLVTEVWVVGVLPLIQVAMLLNWPPGVRLRVVLAATALLVALSVIDVRLTLGRDLAASWPQMLFLSAIMPVVTVSSLWWWDVLVALDRARTSEAKLAATQERLRLATDVHDLQGHHLQVIALQLELAERLMPADPQAGMEQLRAARASVDDARQGTRDLATRFRSVPLRDELANAVDLLCAAGTKAEATVDPDASLAPPSALGPVVRETTTNVLRHGGGRWARLSLTRTDGSWRYEIANDVAAEAPDVPGSAGGAGLDGIARRAAEVDGDLEVRRDGETFTVVVTVPGTVRP
ncbi:two-component system, NarL family, sensor histidine kinase DesK [Promicromonospora umidemergens]|uniref:histidine kinase n=1 Tax=Promicromonospora umidemergens TaxID=629679 RepID=A0ABP8XM49_9MICO|nr:histidine kinase [Promicromonospora umidemergens]MCP2282051.1 two-component system, NarL family, sensor histidine kinase DesK [Promicromonospora umidemergens]